MGAGITTDLQERAGRNTTPAAAAAESFINSRRESLVFLLVDAMVKRLLWVSYLHKAKKINSILNKYCIYQKNPDDLVKNIFIL
jgi:hypothetical protein